MTLSFPLGDKQIKVMEKIPLLKLMEKFFTNAINKLSSRNYLTVTDLARFRGLSGSQPLKTANW